MSNSHTPGPWQIGMTGEHGTYNPNLVCDSHGNVVCAVSEVPIHTTLEALLRSGNTSDAEGLANAEYIVRACNSHEALLEACKAMVALLDQPVFAGLRANNAIAAGDLKQGRAWLESAIAKATKAAIARAKE